MMTYYMITMKRYTEYYEKKAEKFAEYMETEAKKKGYTDMEIMGRRCGHVLSIIQCL